MKSRLKAFTLAELLVVMGIIVLFIALAIPAVRSMTGSSSSSVARNELSALITRAREEAVGVQSVRGVLFFIDPASNRVVGVICQAASLQYTNSTYSGLGIILLDAVPSRDTLMLPQGVRLQTIFNPPTGTYATTRYLGFNPVNGVNVGGCILFDGNGRVIVKPYGFQMVQLNGTTPSLSTLGGILFGQSATPASITGGITDGSTNSFVPLNTTLSSSATLPLSQLGLVLFDTDAFNTQGFVDADSDPMETTKETWIDSNSTPVMVNRFNGTLIRGE